MRRRTQTPIDFWKCGHFSPVVIEEAEGGKIKRATRYFGEPFEAAEWRAQWVERM